MFEMGHNHEGDTVFILLVLHHASFTTSAARSKIAILTCLFFLGLAQNKIVKQFVWSVNFSFLSSSASSSLELCSLLLLQF